LKKYAHFRLTAKKKRLTLDLMSKQSISATIIVILLAIIVIAGSRFFVSVPAGHVAVASLFGEVRDDPYAEGLHIPVNPLYHFTFYDVREKELKETAGVPSQDQLTTTVDVSIKFRINGADAPRMLQETGTFEDAVRVQIQPKLRSAVREQGKSIVRAEDFFLQETQENLQVAIFETMRDYLEPRGIICLDILIRDISLPPFITRAIESKKEREQEVEKQKAELERFRTEQQQKIAQAQAERDAAELEAEQRRVIADAQAYEITKLNEAIAQNPAYVQLQALDALKEISKDASSKIYFLNGESPAPLPLMNMGEPLAK
jgi:regulator of protease activity HflC (stomatin/prohibitin superfamily)